MADAPRNPARSDFLLRTFVKSACCIRSSVEIASIFSDLRLSCLDDAVTAAASGSRPFLTGSRVFRRIPPRLVVRRGRSSAQHGCTEWFFEMWLMRPRSRARAGLSSGSDSSRST
ncbi:Uncharacterized protein DAT39_017993 [Clarias magur]|uniref:Uncharacterized protein n=1 Tax=Clarias magur TaxID=1594786 RepID=A0A8J4U4Y0_CLAMG|nr:Uncharacterized protein DAT39_017993 [Clarias magur]